MRPRVLNLPNNQIKSLTEHLAEQMHHFKGVPGVIGITLNGGLSRGYADTLSEIDVTIYLDEAGQRVVDSGLSDLPLGIVVLAGQLYDIKAVPYASEWERDFGPVDLWDMSYAQIIHDTEDRIAGLFALKLAARPRGEDAADHLWDAYWHYRLAGDIWIARGDVEQGHLVLNRSVEPLLKALFVTNGEFIPHEKWLVHMSRTLSWLPNDYAQRLEQAMVPKEAGVSGLRQRQQVIAELGDDIDLHIRQHHLGGFRLASHQKYFYDLLLWLAERGRIPLAEWKGRSRLSFLSMDPFRLVTAVENDCVVLSCEALRALSPEDMYVWHYEVARAVAAELEDA